MQKRWMRKRHMMFVKICFHKHLVKCSICLLCICLLCSDENIATFHKMFVKCVAVCCSVLQCVAQVMLKVNVAIQCCSVCEMWRTSEVNQS